MKHLKTTLVIGALSTLGPFSVDTYFPSFPSLAAHFGVSEMRMQFALSCARDAVYLRGGPARPEG